MSKTAKDIIAAGNIVAKAVSQIGVKESPAGSNMQKYGRAYGWNGVPWCCQFVWWVFRECGASSLFYNGQKVAYCPYVVTWAKKAGLWLGRTANAQPGDIVLFAGSNGVASHIGIVEKRISAQSVQTIEGNTSTTSNDNGGAVMRRKRSFNVVGSSFYVLGFVRPKYAKTAQEPTQQATTPTNQTTPSKKPLATIAQEVIDGKWGSGTERKKKLTTAGYDYNAVQNMVNELLKAQTTPTKPSAAKFPLPSGHWFGVPSNDTRNHSGYYNADDRPAIKKIQKVVNVSQDGMFGAKTQAAVKKYQKAHGLTQDGEVGARTWAKMFN